MFSSFNRRYVSFIYILISFFLNSLSLKFHNERIIYHELVTKTIRVQDNYIHDVIFCIKQDIDLIDKELMERSTPGSPKYQQWLSSNEIKEFLNTTESYNNLMEYLNNYNDIEIKNVTLNNEFIVASAPITTWETIFNTEFYHWNDMRSDNKKVHVLAEEYTVPIEIVDYVDYVLNTVQLPPIFKHIKGSKIPIEPYESMKVSNKSNEVEKKVHILSTPSPPPPPPPVYTTPSFLKTLYGIDTFQGSSSLSQAVFQTNDEQWSQSDLTKFQTEFRLTAQNAQDVGNRQTNNCQANDNPQGVPCSEGNLDIQYIMGIAQNTVSYVWWVDNNALFGNTFLEFLLEISAIQNVPSVLSISWGSNEVGYPTTYITAFNTKAASLGLQGVTILVSSGDDGVFGFDNSQRGCDCNYYDPSFPATSPYVTAVGATMGPNDWTAEVACQQDLGGQITSGGGFSPAQTRPSWQSSAVSSYLQSTQGKAAVSGYTNTGRGVPDVSFIGTKFVVYIHGTAYSMYGTSASAPLFAGMISLINAKRLASGLGTVGFLNPTLYSNSDKFNDITSGNNKCCSGGCCPSPRRGFTATSGWDPVTGLGSIQFSALKSIYTQTEAPTVSPTFKPTPITRFPTTSPTLRPTVQDMAPTIEPTVGTDIMFDSTISITSSRDLSPLLSSSDADYNIYCLSIKQAIAESMEVSSESVYLESISSTRRLNIILMSINSISINFRVKLSSPFSNAYKTAVSTFKSNFNSGFFSESLSFNSFINGATGLITATVTSIVIGENLLTPTLSPTPGPTDFYQNYYFYIAIAVAGFVLLLIVLGLLYYYRTRKSLYVYGLPNDFNFDDLKLILVGIKTVRKCGTKVLITFESNNAAAFNYKKCKYHEIFYFIHRIKLQWATFVWFEKCSSSVLYDSPRQGSNAVRRTRQQSYASRSTTEPNTGPRNIPVAVSLVDDIQFTEYNFEPQNQTNRSNMQNTDRSNMQYTDRSNPPVNNRSTTPVMNNRSTTPNPSAPSLDPNDKSSDRDAHSIPPSMSKSENRREV